jgi:hypothetical protein
MEYLMSNCREEKIFQYSQLAEAYQYVLDSFPGQECISFDEFKAIIDKTSDVDYFQWHCAGPTNDFIRLGISLGVTKEKNLKRLDTILALPDNWNEHGAHKFDEEFISKIKDLVSILKYQPEIFPTATDSIYLEYDQDNGDCLIIDIKCSGKIEIYRKLEGKSQEMVASLEAALIVIEHFNQQENT